MPRLRGETGGGSRRSRMLETAWITRSAMNGEKSIPPGSGIVRRIGARMGSLTFHTNSPRPKGSRAPGIHERITRTKIASVSAPASTLMNASRNTISRQVTHTGSGQVQPVARGRRSGLALVRRAEPRRAVRPLRGGRQGEERELADAHPGVERDRDGVDIRELERDVAVPGGVDEACGAV